MTFRAAIKIQAKVGVQPDFYRDFYQRNRKQMRLSPKSMGKVLIVFTYKSGKIYELIS